MAVHIDDGDEVGGIFADEAEELFAFEELAPNAMDLELLVDRVEIEKQDEADQPPDRLLELEEVLPGFAGMQERRKKRNDRRREEQSDEYGGSPKPPLAALNAAKAVARGLFIGRIGVWGFFRHLGEAPQG